MEILISIKSVACQRRKQRGNLQIYSATRGETLNLAGGAILAEILMAVYMRAVHKTAEFLTFA